jgi:hypothetical protein
VEAIMESFRVVFGGAAGRPDLLRSHLEDYEELAPALEVAGQRHRVGPLSTRVDRIRFSDGDFAEVRFQITLGVGMTTPFEGRTVRREGRWLVSRETAAEVLARGGVQAPPRIYPA